MINPQDLSDWNKIWNESKKDIYESKVKLPSGYLTEAEAQQAIEQPRGIVIKSAGTKPIPHADFKTGAGSKLRLINAEINEKDGVLFSDDEQDYDIINRMTGGNISGTVVEIMGKDYPVLAIQKMGGSSRWSFVLDYDENKPKKPSKKPKTEAKRNSFLISKYPVSYKIEDDEGEDKIIQTTVDVIALVDFGIDNNDPRDAGDFEIDKIIDTKTQKELDMNSDEFQKIFSELDGDDDFATAVWDATKDVPEED